ncbi:sensor histidine kinase [Paenibacillus sp. TRM 82003]|nr:sensor histidine kinase [Paenibacillus sp. TRM 82003]
MRTWKERLRPHGLFLQMFFIMVVSIVAVSVLTSWTTIRISERLFIETFSITNTKVLQQMKSSLTSFHTSIVNASNSALQSGSVKQFLSEADTDSLTMAKAYFNMRQTMDQVATNVNMYEVGILVHGVNGRSYATSRHVWPIGDDVLRAHPITARALSEPRRMTYHYYRSSESSDGGGEPTIVVTKALMERTTGNVYGTIYFAVRESGFKRFYESYTSTGNDFVVMNRAGLIVSSNNESLIGEQSNELLAHASDIDERNVDFKNIHVMGRDHIILAQYLPFYDMYLVNLIDKELALGKLIDTRAIAFICFVISAGALTIVFLIFRRLTKSLTRLVKQIANISKYDFDHYVTETGSYETKQLARAFNTMMDELRDYLKELIETQKKQRDAELVALQRQINPHFLYNTLASIKFMVKQGSKEKAAETINALITLLQNAIGNGNETVSVEDEIDILKHYVFINQARHGDRIQVNYFVSPECMEARVPKLVIQPFIENAFFHAFQKKTEGYVYVLISRDGNTLLCEVADNGDGMAWDGGDALALPKSKWSRQMFTGIGVRNVHERLRLMYGEPYGVDITSEIGVGTQIKIRIPFLTDAVNI